MKLGNDNIYSLQEYATQKKVSLKTVYNWIKSGYIQPILIGKTKFIIPKKNGSKTDSHAIPS
jgi:predicted site-specific integrase-resolvase